MTEKEYLDNRIKLLKKHDDEISDLQRTFAFSNSQHFADDIIKDHIGFGKIISIKYTKRSYYSTELPECVYYCEELTAKQEPKKRPSKRFIYKRNLI